MNTGIVDDLTGVVFWGSNGAVSGHKGLYYTTTGGVGPSSWTQFSINTNAADSTLLSNTRFNHCYAASVHPNYAFACGEDTINHTAVIFQFFIPTQSYTVLFQGSSNTKLNNIHYSTDSDQYYAFGDNGLLVYFNLNITGLVEPSGSSIHFQSGFFYTDKLTIGANENIIKGVDNNPGLTLTTTYHSGKNFKDTWRYATNSAYAVGDALYSINHLSNTATTYTNYDFGPLNANSIYKVGSLYFIGTDHGIFRFSNTNSIEWQPSSMQYFIYDFWVQSSPTVLYACGKDGVLLSTTDNGGLPLPYMSVVEAGGCKGQSLVMSGTYGSASTCKWFLNGVQVSSSCSNYSMIGNTPGMYEIKFKGTNTTGTDSALTYFYVVDTPYINKPFLINDYVLCKEESIDIEIDQSQMDVFYQLIGIPGGTSYGSSPYGNGGIITFSTSLISQEGNYVLQAYSSLAACSKKFTDTIVLSVDHTTADYHITEQNISPAEETKFYQTCTDATNFAWEFPAGSTYLTSNLGDPVNAFSAIGNQQIKLICWSDNLCYDTIVGPGPTVYAPPAVYDSCWVNVNDGDDPSWEGHFYPEISDISPVTDGYIITGTFHDHAYATKYGDSLYLDGFGAYLCKYDKNGVYKWNVHAVGAGNVYGGVGWPDKYIFHSSAQDTNGNIYACAYFNDYYVDNIGDTITTSNGFGHLIKLDSLGKTIWELTTSDLYPQEVSIDHAGNVLITSSREDNAAEIVFYLNGIATDTVTVAAMSNFGLTKISSDGAIIWDIPILIDHVNYSGLIEVKFDSANNIYLAGTYELEATVYSVGITETIDNSGVSTYGGKIMLAKFNPAGTLQWLTRSYTLNIGSDATRAYDLTTDDAGNCYLSGSNDCRSPGHTHYFENTDGTNISHDGGQYFVAKVNTQGICQWIHGVHQAYYGSGTQSFLDEDTLYVLGYVRQNGEQHTTVQFNNDDNTSVLLDISMSDYFLAVYDTSGYLYRIIKNGDNSPQLGTEFYYGLFRDSEGMFYTTRHQNASAGYNSYSYNDFSDTVTTLNGREGWVTKFCEDCGINYKPYLTYYADTTICIGTNYVLSGGDTLFNVTTQTHDTLLIPTIYYLDSIVITTIHVDGFNNIVQDVWICPGSDYTFPDGAIENNIIAPMSHQSYLLNVSGCDSIITSNIFLLPLASTSLTISGSVTLTSNQSPGPGVTYQWVDCNNGFSHITGEQGQSFTPSVNGEYAVITSFNGCPDTSNCVMIGATGLSENQFGVQVFPNPTNGQIYISFDQVNDFSSLRILNVLGQEVETISMLSESMIVNLPRANGIYYLQFISASGESFTSVISKM